MVCDAKDLKKYSISIYLQNWNDEELVLCKLYEDAPTAIEPAYFLSY